MSITEDILISYALGHLTPEEEAAVEAHLNAHPEDAATVAGYLDSLVALVMSLPPEPLADGGEAELLARVRAEGSAGAAEGTRPPVVVLPEPSRSGVPRTEAAPQRSRVLRYGWLGALAAAAVVALLYLTVLTPPDPEAQVAQELQEYQAQPGAVSYTLTAEGQPDPLGTLVRLSDGRVFVALSEPPAAERVYQAWEIAEAPVSLGTFDGHTFLSAAAVTEGNTFGLTLEPPGGSEQPTTTPITLVEL